MVSKKNKDKVYSFRLSSEDAAIFEEKLAASKMKKSAFFREVFINSNVNITVESAPPKDYKRLLFLVNKSSNNLNQIAHKINLYHSQGIISDLLYRKLLNNLITIRDLLFSGVKNAD